MQQTQSQYLGGARLSTSSHSSTTVTTNVLLNGLLPSPRSSQTLGSFSLVSANHNSNQSRALPTCNNQLKRSERLKHIMLIISLTIIFALLLITTIELATTLVRHKSEENLFISNLSLNTNETRLEKDTSIHSFFACVWFFNILLFFICLFVHSLVYQRRSQGVRAKAAFLR